MDLTNFNAALDRGDVVRALAIAPFGYQSHKTSEDVPFHFVVLDGPFAGKEGYSFDLLDAVREAVRPPLQKPMYHLNGTDPMSAYQEYKRVRAHVALALESLRAVTPHMRNFYPMQGGGKVEYDRACRDHWEMAHRLERVAEDLEELAAHAGENLR